MPHDRSIAASTVTGATALPDPAGATVVPDHAAGKETTDAAGRPSPRSHLPLRVALLYSVANLGAGLIYSLFLSAMPKYLDSYHLRPELIGLLSSERSLIGSLTQPFAGRMSDRIRTPLGRRRPFFLVGVPLTALALVALGFHPALGLMIALVALASFFFNVAQDPYVALMADISLPEQRGRLGAYLGFSGLLGAIIFNLVAAALWSKHQFAVFLFAAGGLLCAYTVTFFTVREPARVSPAARLPTTPLRYLRDLLRRRELIRFVGAIWLFDAGLGGANPFAVLFGSKTLHLPDSQAFLLVIIIALSTAAGVVPAGLLGDRLGKKRILIAGMVIIVVGALAGARVHSIGWAIPALVLFGLGSACTTALNLPILTEIVPAGRTGEILGLCSSIWATAPAVGAVCAGHFINSALPDTYRNAFIWAGILVGCAAAILLTLRLPQSGDDASARVHPAHGRDS